MDFRSLARGEDLPSLTEWYPWPEGRPWLRCMMRASLDGAVHGDGDPNGALSCLTDQHVFTQVRRFPHAVLVDAGTLRSERYEPLLQGADSVERVARGLTPAPVLVVVTSSMDLPWDEPVFSESTMTPLVVTNESAPHAAIERARRHCEVLALPGPWLDPFQLVSAIAYRGMTHVLCEGGPNLLAQLSRAGLIDEADITIAPILASGGQLVTGEAIPTPPQMALAGVIEQDGWLFTRYVRHVDRERALS